MKITPRTFVLPLAAAALLSGLTNPAEAQATQTTIHLKSAVTDQFFRALRGGGSGIVVDRSASAVRSWETFTLTDLNGGTLDFGDAVRLQAANGQYLVAEGSGGGGLFANRDQGREWETFRFESPTAARGGTITPDVLRPRNGVSRPAPEPFVIRADNGTYLKRVRGTSLAFTARFGEPRGDGVDVLFQYALAD